MTLQTIPDKPRHAIGRCQDCGAQTTYYRGGKNARVIRCPVCREKAHREQTRESEMRRNPRNDDGKHNHYMLVHDPRGMDLWGSMPVFSDIDLDFALGYGKYDSRKEYPFIPGCEFRGQRGGLYRIKVDNDGYLVRRKVNQ